MRCIFEDKQWYVKIKDYDGKNVLKYASIWELGYFVEVYLN
jgi:hypothetical protein